MRSLEVRKLERDWLLACERRQSAEIALRAAQDDVRRTHERFVEASRKEATIGLDMDSPVTWVPHDAVVLAMDSPEDGH